MRAAEADLPPIPLRGSPALLFTCSPALCLFQPAPIPSGSPARKSLTGSGTSVSLAHERRSDGGDTTSRERRGSEVSAQPVSIEVVWLVRAIDGLTAELRVHFVSEQSAESEVAMSQAASRTVVRHYVVQKRDSETMNVAIQPMIRPPSPLDGRFGRCSVGGRLSLLMIHRNRSREQRLTLFVIMYIEVRSSRWGLRSSIHFSRATSCSWTARIASS